MRTTSKNKSATEKLISYEELPEDQKKLYQREKRLEQKEHFRNEMKKTLGKDFEKLGNTMMKHGIESFKDFIDPDKFQKFIDAYSPTK